MQFECVATCTAQYSSRRALTQHQNGCEHVRALHARILSTNRRIAPDSSSSGSDSDQPAKRHRIESPEPNLSTKDNTSNGPASLQQPPSTTSPPPTRSQRPKTRAQVRLIRAGFHQDHDILPIPDVPESGSHMDTAASFALGQQGTPPIPRTRQRFEPLRTEPDAFGRFRIYPTRPPVQSKQVAAHIPSTHGRPRPVNEIIKPCPNISTYYLMRHHWLGGATKSLESRDSLVFDVLLRPDFQPRELIGVNLKAVDKALIDAAKSWNPLCPPSVGWRNIPLQLQVPPIRSQATSQTKYGDHFVEVSGLRARKLTDVMRKAFSSNNCATFNYVPYESMWRPPGSNTGPAQRIMDEIYTSPTMLAAHKEVQALSIRDSRCTLPRCVAAWMFSSDGLQFGSFSHAKGWPIFAWFGNESKYERCKPTSNSCFHIAHVPVLPDKVKEKITRLQNGKSPSDALLTHLRRKLMHEVWNALLDDDFIDAWNNGIVIECADGITRRVFPRIITYSADYPEKVLIAAIRNGGQCLCPRCLVPKAMANQMGTVADMKFRVIKRRRDNVNHRKKILKAREIIYTEGRAIQSDGVEALLKGESYVPTRNAFSRRLGTQKFDIFSCLVVDQLHEIELGVWKTLFKHLIRLLHLSGPESVTEFNARFRMVPTFGASIRMFSDDVAGMGRIAARNFEDILQCCIPVFQGLLPPRCDSAAQTLLFTLAEWHGLAKLRLHTTTSLSVMKALTIRLGSQLRDFATLTEHLDVRETPQEYARRRKRNEQHRATSMAKRQQAGQQARNPLTTTESSSTGRQKCTLNLNTYKMHAVGDYDRTIGQYGTTDSYSTQIGELQNRQIKLQYSRTNKRDTEEQMTGVGDICEVLQDMEKEIQERDSKAAVTTTDLEDSLDCQDSRRKYWIGEKDRSEDRIPNIFVWIEQHRQDVTRQHFIPQLKQHLLGRITGNRTQVFTNHELAQLRFHKQQLFSHRTLHINYTSYNILREHDVLNPLSRNSFVLLPAEFEQHPGAHPFLYAKILGIYHAHIEHKQDAIRRMDFVHVRWLYYDYDTPGGRDIQRLDRLSYEPCHSDQDLLDSFDFVDPNDIVRAAHLIPQFSSGWTSDFLPCTSSIGHDRSGTGDWTAYYVNRFVDRDMLMRGGGIGHSRYNQPSGHKIIDAPAGDIIADESGGEDEDEEEDADEETLGHNDSDEPVSDQPSSDNEIIHKGTPGLSDPLADSSDEEDVFDDPELDGGESSEDESEDDDIDNMGDDDVLEPTAEY